MKCDVRVALLCSFMHLCHFLHPDSSRWVNFKGNNARKPTGNMIFNSAICKKNQIYWPGVWALIYTVVQKVSKLYCKNPITDRPRTIELIIWVTKTFPFTENPKSLMATVVQDGVKAYLGSAQYMATCQNYVIGGWEPFKFLCSSENVTNGVKWKTTSSSLQRRESHH